MAAALTLASAALTASGRLQLLPTEVELRLLDKVDVEFPGGVGGVGGDLAPKFVVCVCMRVFVRARARACAPGRQAIDATVCAPTRVGCCASRRTA